MSVNKDKRNGRWRYAFMYQGLRYTGSAPSTDNTKAAAKAEERAHLDRLRSGVTGKRAPKVGEFIDRFLAYQAGECKPLTVENQSIHLNQHTRPVIGQMRLDSVTRLHLDDLKARWLKTSSPRTVNARIDTVRRMFALAVEWQILAKAPTVKRVRIVEDHPRFLTEVEATALLDAAAKEWRAMIVVALRTGMRIGELRGLQWGDLDEHKRMLHVRRTDPGRPDLPSNGPKGGRTRTLPLTPDALAALLEVRPDNPPPRLYVWPALLYRARRGIDTVRPRSTSGCWHGIRSAVDGAKISEPTEEDKIGWHTLRHTFASWLVMRGVPLRVVQDLLGHKSIRQTERYAHLSPNTTHHAAVASLDLSLADPDYRQPANALPGPDPERNDAD